MASKLSPALQAKLDALRNKAKLADAQAAPAATSAMDTAAPQVVETEPAPREVTKAMTTVRTAIPTPQPHVIKPSMVSIEGAGEYEPFKMKLAELEQQLEGQVPGFATTLRDIHRELARDVNIVTILSQKEIALIVSGLARHMDTTVVVAKKSSSRKTQPILVDEL